MSNTTGSNYCQRGKKSPVAWNVKARNGKAKPSSSSSVTILDNMIGQHQTLHVCALLPGIGTRRQWPRPRQDRYVSLQRPRWDVCRSRDVTETLKCTLSLMQ